MVHDLSNFKVLDQVNHKSTTTLEEVPFTKSFHALFMDDKAPCPSEVKEIVQYHSAPLLYC